VFVEDAVSVSGDVIAFAALSLNQIIGSSIPGQVWIVARIGIEDGLRGSQVRALVRGIESRTKHEAKEVYRVDVVPMGEDR
jgi:hypothetical protein